MLSLFRKSKTAEKPSGGSNASPVVAAHKHKHSHRGSTWGDCSADGGWEGKVACSKQAGYVFPWAFLMLWDCSPPVLTLEAVVGAVVGTAVVEAAAVGIVLRSCGAKEMPLRRTTWVYRCCIWTGAFRLFVWFGRVFYFYCQSLEVV